MSEIIKSLPLYNPKKGRLFAYLNRISKNNLIQFKDREEKYESNNVNYSDILYNPDENNITSEEKIDNIINTEIDEEKIIDTLENTSSNFTPKPRNKVIKCKSSLYIIYKYICFLFITVNYYYNNTDEFKNLIENMKYDTTADFDFCINLKL